MNELCPNQTRSEARRLISTLSRGHSARSGGGLVAAMILSASATVSFAQPCLSFEDIVLSPTVGYTGASSVALGDIDNDSYIDMVIANRNSFATLGVRYGLLGGGFGPDVALDIDGVEGTSNWANLTDYNHDGNLDVILASRFPNRLRVLEGHGDGTFSFVSSAPINMDTPQSIALADFDNDGQDEALVGGVNGVELFDISAMGIATFTQHVADDFMLYPDAADIDGDGWVDALIASEDQRAVFLFMNDGAGHLALGSLLQVDSEVANTAKALDFDMDGDLDVAVTTFDNAIWIFEQVAPGQFDSGTRIDVSQGAVLDPWHLSVGDLNGDSFPDLVFTSAISDTIGVMTNLAGRESTLVSNPIYFQVNSVPNMSAIADIDDDGDLDIVAVDMGGGTDGQGSAIAIITNTTAGSPCYADITGDNTVDIYDLVAVFVDWGKNKSPADLNSDFDVNGVDLAMVLNNWSDQ